MQNFHDVRALLDTVVNENWRMDQLTNARPASNRTSDVGEPLQKLYVVEKGVPEAFRSLREVGPGILEDVLEIV